MDKFINDKTILRYSKLTGRYFNIFQTVRILNTAQATFYVTKGVLPLDVYASKDFKNKRDVLVFLFSKDDTRDLYEEWCSRTEKK